MEILRQSRRFLFLAATVPGLLLSGCFQYRVESTVKMDGSGTRSLAVILPEEFEQEWEMSLEMFRSVFGATEEDGWVYKQQILPPDHPFALMPQQFQISGKQRAEMVTVHMLRKEIQIPDVDSWAEQSGDVRLAGKVGDVGVGTTKAYIGNYSGAASDDQRWMTVSFQNSIQMESGWYGDRPTRTYRETFYWENLTDLLVEKQVSHVGPHLDQHFPNLAPQRKGEIVGLIKGGLWSAIEQGFFEFVDWNESERAKAFEHLIYRLTRESLRIVQKDYPEAKDSDLRDLVRKMIVEAEEMDEDKLEDWPGVAMAFNTEFVIELKIEGEILETNAHERRDDALIWTITPMEAMAKPIEIYAEVHLEK